MSSNVTPPSSNNEGDPSNAPTFNFYLGVSLALLSTLFIGFSFIVKKKALKKLECIGTRAGDGGYGYLRDWLWWAGFLLMGIGEGANFVAYAFAPASLVTPLGGLTIIVTAVLSSKFLKEKLNLIAKIGCAVCLSGSTMVVLHAPKEQEIESMQELTKKFVSVKYLVFAALIVIAAVSLIFCVGPRYGKKNPMVYLSISGTIGSLSVMACKGIGVGIREAFVVGVHETVNSALFWLLIVQLIFAICVQMNYLNMALDIFNTNIVTPLMYVIFTGSVLVASAVLFNEWPSLGVNDHVGNVCGLSSIIAGIFLLTVFRDLEVNWHNLQHVVQPKSPEPRNSSNQLSNSDNYSTMSDLRSRKFENTAVQRRSHSGETALLREPTSETDTLLQNYDGYNASLENGFERSSVN